MIHQRAYDKLRMLNNASLLHDLKVPLLTNWKNYQEIGEHNIVSVLTNNGAFALSGLKLMRMTWK
jgi:hypothetical protein